MANLMSYLVTYVANYFGESAKYFVASRKMACYFDKYVNN